MSVSVGSAVSKIRIEVVGLFLLCENGRVKDSCQTLGTPTYSPSLQNETTEKMHNINKSDSFEGQGSF